MSATSPLGLDLPADLVEPLLHLGVGGEEPLLLGRRLVALRDPREEGRQTRADRSRPSRPAGSPRGPTRVSSDRPNPAITTSVVLSTACRKTALLPVSVSCAPSWIALPFWIALIACLPVTWISLVREHARQLGLVGHQPQCAARDVNVPAGSREGVDAVGVEHDEVPVEVRPAARLRR